MERLIWVASVASGSHGCRALVWFYRSVSQNEGDFSKTALKNMLNCLYETCAETWDKHMLLVNVKDCKKVDGLILTGTLLHGPPRHSCVSPGTPTIQTHADERDGYSKLPLVVSLLVSHDGNLSSVCSWLSPNDHWDQMWSAVKSKWKNKWMERGLFD